MYSNKSHFNNHPRVLVDTKLNEHEHPVVRGLAMTPSEMDRLRLDGVPVSQTNLEGMYFDGVEEPSFDLPLDLQRGVDAADLYQESKSAARRLKKGEKRLKDSIRYAKKVEKAQKIDTPPVAPSPVVKGGN